MQTVRAINAGKTSRKARKLGAHNQPSTSTARTGSDTAAETRGGGEGTSKSQEGDPGAGEYPTVIKYM